MDNKQPTTSRGSQNTGLESLQYASVTEPEASAKIVARTPPTTPLKRPNSWRRRGILVVLTLALLGSIGGAGLQFKRSLQSENSNQDVLGVYKPSNAPVLGNETQAPIQSLLDDKVSINGNLVLNGDVTLSAAASASIAGAIKSVVLGPVVNPVQQTGSINLNGQVTATTFQGNGAALGNLNANSITSGTLSNDRLDSSVTRLGQTIPLSALQGAVLTSVNSVSSNTGNVNLVGGAGITITPDTVNKTITITSDAIANSGDITSVIAGAGLTGGGTTGDVTLSIDAGTITMQGNNFNGADQLVKLDNLGRLTALDGSALISLNAGNISSGTLSNSRLSNLVTLQGNSFNTGNQLVQLVSGELPAVSGTNLTNLYANSITTGTIDDARLSNNVAKLNGNQTFTGNNTLTGSALFQKSANSTTAFQIQNSTGNSNLFVADTANTRIGIGTATPGYALDVVGDINASTSLKVGGNTVCTTSGCQVVAGSSNYIQNGTTTQNNANINIQSANQNSVGIVVQGAVSQVADLIQAKNSGGTAVTTVDANGNVNTTGQYRVNGSQIASSNLSNDSNLAKLNGNQTFTGNNTLTGSALFQKAVNSTTAFQIQNSAGNSNLFVADTTNTRIGIGTATPGYALDVVGDINASTSLKVGGNTVCISTGCSASSGSNSYIQNGTASQTANFNIQSAAAGSVVGILQGASSQSADLLQLKNSGGTVIAKVDKDGNINTTGQFQVNGSQIASSNLSNDSNLAKLNGNQTFSGSNTFSSGITTDSITPTTALTLGSTSKAFTLQGTSASVITASNNGFTTTVGFNGTASGTLAYNFDVSSPAGTYTICTTYGNCAGTGGGVTSPGGNINKIAKFQASGVIGDSSISDNGSLITLGSSTLVQPVSNSTTTFQIQNSAGNSNLFVADTTNTRIGIGTATPGYTLDVVGTINASTNILVNGTAVCTVATCASAAGSGGYIHNDTATQVANFNIQSGNAANVVAVFRGALSQSADLIQAKINSGSTVFSVGSDGSTTINANPSTQALLVTGASSENVLKVDSSSNRVLIGNTDPYSGAFKQVISGSVSNGSLALNPTNAGDYALAVGYGGTNNIRSYITGAGAGYFGPVNSTTAFQIQNSAGNSNLFVADTSNTRIGIGTATPGYTVDVNGDVNISSGSAFRINGVAICGISTCAPSAGSSNYIQNSTTTQTNGNFNIQSAAAGSVVAVLQGAASQSADLLQLKNSGGTVIAKVDKDGNINTTGQFQVNGSQIASSNLSNDSNLAKLNGNQTFTGNNTLTGSAMFQKASNSTTAFQIQNSAGNSNLFIADTTNTRIAVGMATAGYTLDVNGDVNIASGSVFRINGVAICGISTCAPSSGSSYYIQNGTSSQPNANLSIQSSSASAVTAVFQGAASQSADILQAKNSGGTAVASIDANGNINTTGQFQVNGSQIASSNLSNDSNLAKLNGNQTFTGNNTLTGSALFQKAVNSTTAFQIQNSAGNSNLFVADTANTRIGIGTATPGYALDVVGDINASTSLKVGGNTVCTSSGCSANASSVIQNGTSTQTGANFNIESNSTSSVTATVKAIASQTVSIFEARDGSGNLTTSLGPSGDSVFRTTTNSATAYQIQNSTGNGLVSVDTTNTNLVTNSSFDVDTSGWAIDGAGVTIAQTAVQQYNGGYSLAVTTPGTANRGAKYPLTTTTLASNTTYTFSVYARTLTSSMSTFEIGRAEDGSTETSCLTGRTVIATGWTKYGCTFTTGTTSGTPYVYAKQTDATGRTIYLDSVQLLNMKYFSPLTLLTNTSIESAIAGNWTTKGTTPAVTQSATVALDGTKSLKVVTQATANQGTKQNITLNDSSTYTFTFQAYVTLTDQGATTIDVGYSSDGSTDTSCLNAQSLQVIPATAAWTTFSCTITTPASHSGTPYIYVKNTAAAIKTFYLDYFNLYQYQGITSNNAVQLQNATTTNLFAIDGQNSQITVNGGFNGEIKPWTTNSTTPGTFGGQATAILNGYIYAMGGMTNGSTANCGIRYAKINANGSIGGWTLSPQSISCPDAAHSPQSSATVMNGRIFVGFGGTGALSSFTTNSDGSVVASSLNTSTGFLSCNGWYPHASQYLTNANGYLYVNGVMEQFNHRYVARLTIDQTGSITNCSSYLGPSYRTNPSDGAASVMANGYLYTIGGHVGDVGYDGAAYSDVRYVKINSDGSITNGTELTTTPLPVNLSRAGAVYSNGNIYVMGGTSSYYGTTVYNTVYFARVNSDGTLGTWNISMNPLPTTRASFQSQVYNGYIYSIGGDGASGVSQSQIYYTSLPRLQVNASIDLVGDLGVGSYSDVNLGSAGGSITAGHITAVNGLEVYGESQHNGNTQLNGNTQVNGTFKNTGANATFTSSANSTTAFQVQNAALSSLLTVDSTNAQISVNNTANAELTNWLTTTSTSNAYYSNGTVTLNGYIYAIGGYTGSAQTATKYAKLNGDGTTGTWAAATASLTALTGNTNTGAATYNGFIYVVRNSTSAAVANIQYAKPSASGDIAAWSTAAGTLATGTFNATNNVIIANGYLYIVATGASYQDVYRAKINSDGSIGSITTLTTPWGAVPKNDAASVVSNGYLLVIGGRNGTTAAGTSYYMKLNTDGTLGTGASAGSLPASAVRCGGGAFTMNGFVYYIGGSPSASCAVAGSTTSIYYGRVSSTGTITWSTATAVTTQTLNYFNPVVNNGYVYFVQGQKAGAASNTVTYMTGPRLQVTASIDLVTATAGAGDSNDNTGGSGGGSIYAGKISAAGGLEVNGNSQLFGGASINGVVQVNGTASYIGLATGNLLSVGALTTADALGRLVVSTDATGNKGIVVQGFNGQTGDLLQAQDYQGNVLAKIDASGNLTVKNIVSTGGITTALSAKTGAYSVTANDSIITCDTTSAGFNITLPTAVSAAGREYTVKKINAANTCTVATTSSQTIDGAGSYALTAQWSVVTVVSDGANWIIKSKF